MSKRDDSPSDIIRNAVPADAGSPLVTSETIPDLIMGAHGGVKSKKKRGPKPKGKEKLLGKKVGFRLTPSEKQQSDAYLKRYGIRRSDFYREVHCHIMRMGESFAQNFRKQGEHAARAKRLAEHLASSNNPHAAEAFSLSQDIGANKSLLSFLFYLAAIFGIVPLSFIFADSPSAQGYFNDRTILHGGFPDEVICTAYISLLMATFSFYLLFGSRWIRLSKNWSGPQSAHYARCLLLFASIMMAFGGGVAGSDEFIGRLHIDRECHSTGAIIPATTEHIASCHIVRIYEQ